MGDRLVSVIQRKPTSTNCGGEFSQQGGVGGEGGAVAGGGGGGAQGTGWSLRLGWRSRRRKVGKPRGRSLILAPTSHCITSAVEIGMSESRK